MHLLWLATKEILDLHLDNKTRKITILLKFKQIMVKMVKKYSEKSKMESVKFSKN